MANRYWVGADSSWNTAGNWSTSSGGPGGAGVPTSADDAIFDSGDVTSCTCDVAINVASLTVSSGYSGTLDLADSSYAHAVSGNVTISTSSGTVDLGNCTITVGGNWDHSSMGGTLTGATSTLVMNGTGKTLTGNISKRLSNITISGTITTAASSGNKIGVNGSRTITISGGASLTTVDYGGFAFSSSGIVSNSGTFDTSGTTYNIVEAYPLTISANTGTWGVPILSYRGGSLAAGTYNASVTFDHNFGNNTININGNVTIGGSLTILGNAAYTLGFDTNDYNLTLQGDVQITITTSTFSWVKGTGTITFSGSTNQDVDFNGESVEDFVINKSAGTVTLAGDVQTDSLTISDGGLDIDSFALDVSGNFTMSAGTSVADTTTGGTISIGGNLDINGSAVNGCVWSDADIDVLSGTGDAQWCTVSNSTNSSGTAIDATNNCTDGGGNTGWTFSAAAFSVSIGSTEITNMYIGSTPITAVYIGSTQIWP